MDSGNSRIPVSRSDRSSGLSSSEHSGTPEGLQSLSRRLAQRNAAEDSDTIASMDSQIQIPTHYTWEVAGRAFSVQLDYDFVDRLSMEIMRGFGLVPKRGAEVGGVLLGSIEISDKVVIRVEDFEIVSCDYLKGPSFLLSPAEENRFAATVKRYEGGENRRLYVVGIFRSHTRDSQLALADEDIELFERYTNDPSNVILLVRPFATKAPIGALFFEEEGAFRREASLKEFPFRRRELGGAPVLRSSPAEESTAKAEQEPSKAAGQDTEAKSWAAELPLSRTGASALPSENAASTRFRRKWILIPLSFIFLLLGIVAGFQAALVLNGNDEAQVAYDSLGLDLEAAREQDGILLKWNRRAPAVRYSRGATLYIEDGEFRKTVRLDATQLQNGSVMYRGLAAGIVFRLEIETQRRTFLTESVQFAPGVRTYPR